MGVRGARRVRRKTLHMGRRIPSTWQVDGDTHEGSFATKDTDADGYKGIAPVARFPANGYGLFDMAGNIWLWTSDGYRPDYYKRLAAEGVAKNPQGSDSAFDPAEPAIKRKCNVEGHFFAPISIARATWLEHAVKEIDAGPIT
jgi:formylglycine-generating enzyme required for sulfatase activity